MYRLARCLKGQMPHAAGESPGGPHELRSPLLGRDLVVSVGEDWVSRKSDNSRCFLRHKSLQFFCQMLAELM